MRRKFRFLGYGNRTPFEGNYSDINLDTQYYFTDIVLTVGRVYEALYINDYEGDAPSDAKFIDDEGTVMTQELRFFEEVFVEPSDLDLDGWEWTMSLPVPSPKELAQMDANAEELRNDFTGA